MKGFIPSPDLEYFRGKAVWLKRGPAYLSLVAYLFRRILSLGDMTFLQKGRSGSCW